jgi:hypothetical protein
MVSAALPVEPWNRSFATQGRLEELVEEGLPRPITSAIAPEWIVPDEGIDVPNPPAGYVLSFMAFHERGLCNRTDQIIRAQVQKQAPEMLKFSNLSPYNPGSQSKPRRTSNQLAYNQDRIIQHNSSHVTFYKYLIKSLQHHGVTIITNQVYKVAEA